MGNPPLPADFLIHDQNVLKYNGKLESTWGSALYDIEELPYINGVHDMPDSFTPFRNKMEKKCKNEKYDKNRKNREK